MSKTNLDHGINRKYREKHQEVCRDLERRRFITTNSWWKFCRQGNVLPLNLSWWVPKLSKNLSNRSIKTGEGQQNCQDKSWWHFSRRIHYEAFKALSATIDTQIIEDEEVLPSKDLNTQYNAVLLEIDGDEFENSSILQKLETKLK